MHYDSVEEFTLAAAQADGVSAAPQKPAAKQPAHRHPRQGQISRLIYGGNLISGYAHSRDLI